MGRFSLNRLQSIERWWELVFSAYLMISLHAQAFKDEAARNTIVLNCQHLLGIQSTPLLGVRH